MLLVPLLLLVLALIPRLLVLDWGLPYVEHSDEPNYIETVVDMVQAGDPNPRFYRHPTLVFYLLTIATRAYGWWQIQTGALASFAELPNKTYGFTVDVGLYVWNRGLIAILGALTVVLVYMLGRRMFDLRTALLAAALIGVSRFHVEHSYYIATSGPTALTATLFLLCAWNVARTGRWRDYLAAGAATGLAAATKYNAGIIGLALGIAALLYAWGRWGEFLRLHVLRLVAAAATALLVFGIVMPYAVLDWRNFIADVTGQSGFYELGGGNFEGPWNFAGYAQFFFERGLAWSGVLLVLVGTPLLLHKKARPTILLVAVIAIELALLLSYTTNFVRNLLIIYPAVVLLAAASAVALADWIGTWLGRRVGIDGPQTIDIRTSAPQPPAPNQIRLAHGSSRLILAILTLALLFPQFEATIWLLRYWNNPHTLVLAAETLRAQPRGMLAAVESNPVQWAGDPAVQPLRWLGSYDADWYRARGYRYLLLNSERYGLEDQANYRRLLESGQILMTMPDRDSGAMPGPGGAVLDLGAHPDMIPFVRRQAVFGDVAELLGYELRPGDLRERITPLEGADERTLSAGQPLQINLYWRALNTAPIDYTLFVHLYNAADERVAQRDLPLRYSDYPTSGWVPGEFVIDRADMPLPALAPGDYQLRIGLYNAADGTALPAAGGAPVVLATITIR